MKGSAVLTAAQKQDLVTRYLSGETATDLAGAFGVTRQAITGLLRRRGISVRNSGKLSVGQRSDVVQRYQAGETASAIAESYGITAPSVLGLLHRRGVQVRGQSQHSLWHEAFDAVTPEAAYWVGLLFADGTVSFRDGRLPTVGITLTESDYEHLVALRAFLRSTHAISKVPGHRYGRYQSAPAFRFAVRSDRLAGRLLALGRYEGPISDQLTRSGDFWRGVIDGDGSVGSYNGKPQIRLVGSECLLQAFCDYLGRMDLASLTVRPHKGIFTVGTTGPSARRITALLYGDQGRVALARKAFAARSVIDGDTATITVAAQLHLSRFVDMAIV